MAHQRAGSNVEGIKEPHSVSLKVLRLSRPSLSFQHPLPTPSPSPSPGTTFPHPSASLAYPSKEDAHFILSPLLTLPPAFGSAYVGETFSCTLCANNERLSDLMSSKTITNIRMEAEMKIPSSATPIPLSFGTSESDGSYEEEVVDKEVEKDKEEGVDLEPEASLQKIINFSLKEEGSHVLAVTVTYTETAGISDRARTFRKLYQFVCKGCVVVRTKTGVLTTSSSAGGKGRWTLEAQLENTGEETVMLDTVVLEANEGIKSQGLNWTMVREGESVERPILMPGDVQQVCFVVEEVGGKDLKVVDGAVGFGILRLAWRGSMGNRGILSTGLLSAKVS
ncbi:hypothetical protein BJ878DRAFT_502253 [Calycina marina]|uniref:Trafficking protein particle complex subunit 13 n=1 Tax=Calycina marina TaxID=1763456 RepID=A0A9P8CFY4_9HELO|nr:hypothetical protein BJ878DRAFT_502253 [Calycina marina]